MGHSEQGEILVMNNYLPAGNGLNVQALSRIFGRRATFGCHGKSGLHQSVESDELPVGETEVTRQPISNCWQSYCSRKLLLAI